MFTIICGVPRTPGSAIIARSASLQYWSGVRPVHVPCHTMDGFGPESERLQRSGGRRVSSPARPHVLLPLVACHVAHLGAMLLGVPLAKRGREVDVLARHDLGDELRLDGAG